MVGKLITFLRVLILTAILVSVPVGAQQSDSQPASDVAVSVGADADKLIPTSAFADRSHLRGAVLSPDGTKFALRSYNDGVTRITVFDAVTLARSSGVVAGKGDERLEWFRWAGNDKLLLGISRPDEIYGISFRYTRMIAFDLPSNSLFSVGLKRMGIIGDDVLHVADDGSFVLVAIQQKVTRTPDVYRIELTRDAEPVRVQKARADVWDWMADDAGVVRLGIKLEGRKVRVLYRPDAESKFKTIARLGPKDEESKFWDVARIISGSNVGYVLDEDDDGRIGLRKVDYSTGETLETVYEDPDWDLTSVKLDSQGEPLAVYFTDDRDRVVWLREEERRIQTQLEKALPGKDIWIISRAWDNSRFLVSSSSASDPGAMYIFHRQQKELAFLGEFRPSVDEELLAQPKPIDYMARDGTKIRAYLTIPKGAAPFGLPLILLPHGGPYGVRDQLEYNDEVQMLANRGYAVLQPNFRGSGGYGEDFVELGHGQIGRAMQDDLDDAMDWAVGEGIADPDRVCVVGASYGGYAALFAVIRNPERYRCAASFAGVTDWKKQLKYDRAFFSRKGRKVWQQTVRGEDDFDLETVSVYKLGEQLGRPVLLAHGKEDTNVPFSQFEIFQKATQDTGMVETLIFEEEGHGFSEAESETLWYDRLSAFLAKHNPAYLGLNAQAESEADKGQE